MGAGLPVHAPRRPETSFQTGRGCPNSAPYTEAEREFLGSRFGDLLFTYDERNEHGEGHTNGTLSHKDMMQAWRDRFREYADDVAERPDAD